jgi:hypothetical protein
MRLCVPDDRPRHRQAERTVPPQANAYAMIRRRAAAAGIENKLGNHSFQATGSPLILKIAARLKGPPPMVNPRTAQLYDRRRDQRTLDRSSGLRFSRDVFPAPLGR